MVRKSNILELVRDVKQLQIFILGILSGMPLFIIYSTLAAWMKTSSIDIAVITTFAAARIFYSLKFTWSPFVDHIKLPILYRLGRRKSWMFLFSGLISVIIFSYASLNPHDHLGIIYTLTILLGFCSATFDIVIDAYRIDNIDKEKLSMAAANAVFGYRVGGLIAVAGALFVAADIGWSHSFFIIGSLYLLGIVFIVSLKEKECKQSEINFLSFSSWKLMVFDPFADFFKREKAIIILAAVTFYKLGDAMLGVVAMPFYIELGFELKEIAAITKVFGLIATITGAYVGGYIMYKYGNLRGMLICGFAQAITNLSFIWLHTKGHDNGALMITIVIENVASGMGDAALVGYLSYLCNKQFSATQYALLSSFSGLFSHSIVAFGGSIVKLIGWDVYFIMTVFLALPGLAILLYLSKTFKN